MCNQVRQNKVEQTDAQENDILVLVGANHKLRESLETTAKKLCESLFCIREEMVTALIFFSGGLLKFSRVSFDAKNHISESMFNACDAYREMYFFWSEPAQNGV